MKLSAKLVLSFCSIILFMLLLFAVYMRNSQKITATVDHITETVIPSVVAVQSMNALLYSMRSDLAAVSTRTDKVTITEYTSRINRSLRALAEHEKNYAQLAARPVPEECAPPDAAGTSGQNGQNGRSNDTAGRSKDLTDSLGNHRRSLLRKAAFHHVLSTKKQERRFLWLNPLPIFCKTISRPNWLFFSSPCCPF